MSQKRGRWGQAFLKLRFPALTVTIAAIVIATISAVPVQKILVAEWRVKLIDETGAAVPDVRISRGWEYYTFELHGSEERITNSAGTVEFPALAKSRPIIYWIARALPVILNVHGSQGHAGDVNVEGSRIERTPGRGVSAFCSGTVCTQGPIDSELQGYLAEHSEESTNAFFQSNRAALESLAEDWAKDPAATYFSHYDGDTYQWGWHWLMYERPNSFSLENRESHFSSEVRSFTEAARTVGTDELALRKWMERAGLLNVFSIEKREADGGIEIRFPPGGHGLLYAPEGNEKSLVSLRSIGPNGPTKGIDGVMKSLSGRWFYFQDFAPQ